MPVRIHPDGHSGMNHSFNMSSVWKESNMFRARCQVVLTSRTMFMKLSSIAITTALLVATVTGCGGSSETSRDDAIAELLASADGISSEDFVACVADNIYEVLGTESWSDVVDAIENNTVSEEASSSAMLECLSTLTEDELAEFLAG